MKGNDILRSELCLGGQDLPQKWVCTWGTICDGPDGEVEGSASLAELASCNSSSRCMYSSRKARSST